MMKERDHVVLGTLLHDTGKLFERGSQLDQYRNNDTQCAADCPTDHERGYPTHKHVLNTRAFCEWLQDQIPAIRPAEGTRVQEADQHWITFAARHHKPSSWKEKLVAAADHLASAEREGGSVYLREINKKTRLEPILERVSLGQESATVTTAHRLPLLSLTQMIPDTFFPKRGNAFVPPMARQRMENGNSALLSPESLEKEYQQLCRALCLDLEQSGLHQFARQESEIVTRVVVRTLLSVLERHLSQVPAATNVTHPDISLFDHLRVSAAIAEGLYWYHQHLGNATTASFEEMNTPKWCLVCGDFSGIQSFIYRLASKGAAKGLRGRSFFVQLLCDGAMTLIQRELNLLPTTGIYASGGKFYLLIPIVFKDQLRRVAEQINAGLLQAFRGEVSLGIGMADVQGNDFKGGNMGPIWKKVAESLQKDRLRRFRGRMPEMFEPVPAEPDVCAVCGREDRLMKGDDATTESLRCEWCDRMEQVGRNLKETRYLLWDWGGPERLPVRGSLMTLPLPGLNGCCVHFLKEAPVEWHRPSANHHLEALDLTSAPPNLPCAFGWRMIGRWQEEKASGDWEFDTFASQAHGVKRLGVLRMDVDNLGEIFVRGLKPASGELGSLSRMATLSRQLNLFFSGYLNRLVADFSRSQIIYAGGDDLFIIGAWDELPTLARTVQQRFKECCAGNPAFGLSGGLVMVGGKFPITRAADLAGTAEKQAKGLERTIAGKKCRKNAFTFLDTPVGWEEWEQVEKLRADINNLMNRMGNRALLGHLRRVVGAVQDYEQQHQQSLSGTPLSTNKMEQLVYYQRWRWQLVYGLTRLATPSTKESVQGLQDQILNSEHSIGRPVLEWLQLPVRWAELDTRQENN